VKAFKSTFLRWAAMTFASKKIGPGRLEGSSAASVSWPSLISILEMILSEKGEPLSSETVANLPDEFGLSKFRRPRTSESMWTTG